GDAGVSRAHGALAGAPLAPRAHLGGGASADDEVSLARATFREQRPSYNRTMRERSADGTRHAHLGLLIVLLVALASIGCGRRRDACGGSGPDPACHLIDVGGVERGYQLHVPASFRPGASGLVIVLHGSGGSGTEAERVSGLDAKADEAGFAVAIAVGT